MKILTESIVSNSDMIKNYKSCREKAERLGKIVVMKNNQPDAVLLSISEYDRISVLIEHLENLDKQDITKVAETLIKDENLRLYTIDGSINPIK